MNIVHIKYAVEIAKYGSINKAAEVLLVAQPNLSRAIKDLETNLNITIFNRTSRGMSLTPQGEEFIGYAKMILAQIDDIESIYKGNTSHKQVFSVSVPRGSYISDAFARFSNALSNDPAEIFYNETDSEHVVKNILEAKYNLGILRHPSDFGNYYKTLLSEKGLQFELITEFHYILCMHKDHPLCSLSEIHQEDLSPYIEIIHGDPFSPSLPLSKTQRTDLTSNMINRRIFIFERSTQFDLLTQNHNTFMWLSPLPQSIMQRYDLVQRNCKDNMRTYRDVLIYKNDYVLSSLDKLFITELCNAKRRCM